MTTSDPKDTPPVWAQQDGEPHNWFRRFERYKLMGASRSLLGCINKEKAEKSQPKTNDVAGSWRNAAEKWSWKARAEAWDAHIAAKEEAEWEQRRKQLQGQEWELAQKLIDKAQQMLVYPLAKTSREETSTDGKTVNATIILPTKWGMRDAAALIEAASKLGRLASGQATDKHEVAATLMDKRPVQNLTDEQLAAIVLNDEAPNNDDDDDSDSADPDAAATSGA